MRKIYQIDPVPKPRMTRGSVHSGVAKRYWKYKDDINLLGVDIPECNFHIIFVLPMPASWSKKKKERMHGKPHQQRPDTDNLVKSVLDCVYKDDSHVYDFRATKVWGYTGSIIIDDDIEPAIVNI